MQTTGCFVSIIRILFSTGKTYWAKTQSVWKIYKVIYQHWKIWAIQDGDSQSSRIMKHAIMRTRLCFMWQRRRKALWHVTCIWSCRRSCLSWNNGSISLNDMRHLKTSRDQILKIILKKLVIQRLINTLATCWVPLFEILLRGIDF